MIKDSNQNCADARQSRLIANIGKVAAKSKEESAPFQWTRVGEFSVEKILFGIFSWRYFSEDFIYTERTVPMHEKNRFVVCQG